MANYDNLVHELALRINKAINIPLVNEKNEQAVFELVISILMGFFIDELESLSDAV